MRGLPSLLEMLWCWSQVRNWFFFPFSCKYHTHSFSFFVQYISLPLPSSLPPSLPLPSPLPSSPPKTFSCGSFPCCTSWRVQLLERWMLWWRDKQDLGFLKLMSDGMRPIHSILGLLSMMRDENMPSPPTPLRKIHHFLDFLLFFGWLYINL